MFKSVYIIDDDEVSAFLTQAMLAAENFAQAYETFLNAHDALHLLQNILKEKQVEAPEVIFLDLNMPHLDGWKFLEAIRPYAPQLKSCCLLYILTSSVDLNDIRRAQEYDFLAGFLQKPIDEEMIRGILHHS